MWNHFTQQALVWNLCGALAMAFLLVLLLRAYWSPTVAAVGAWWLYEEALTALCSAGRILYWWPVPTGREQCSALVGVQLGAGSLVVIGVLAAYIWNRLEDRDARPAA